MEDSSLTQSIKNTPAQKRFQFIRQEFFTMGKIFDFGAKNTNTPANYTNSIFTAIVFHLLLFSATLPIWLVFSELIIILICYLNFLKDYKSKSLSWTIRIANLVLLAMIASALGEKFPGAIKVAFFACYTLGILMGRPLKRLRSFLTVFVLLALIGLVLSRSANIFYIFILNMDALFLFFTFTKIHQTKESAVAARRLAKETAKILGLIIPVSMTAYFLLPRSGTNTFSLYDKGSFTSGFSEKLNPGRISSLSLSRKIVLRAKFQNTPPPYQLLYWRGEILWHSDGLSWSRNEPNPALDRQETANKMWFDQEIYLDPKYRDWVFALDTPILIQQPTVGRKSFIHLDPGHSYKRLGADYEQQIYTARSIVNRNFQSKLPDSVYLQTPKKISAKIQEFIESNIAPKQSVKEKISYIETYLKDQKFTYSLSPGKTGNNLEAFWFENRKGFCEHYAAAIATIFRLAGIPARVILGFHGGQYSGLSGTYTVRELHAHAWIEYWNQGWKRFDATKFIAPDRLLKGPDDWLEKDGYLSSIIMEIKLLQEEVENSLAHISIWLQKLSASLANPLDPDEWISRIKDWAYILAALIFVWVLCNYMIKVIKRRFEPVSKKAEILFAKVEVLLAPFVEIRKPHFGKIEYLSKSIESLERSIDDPKVIENLEKFKNNYARAKYSQHPPKSLIIDMQASYKGIKIQLHNNQ